MIRFFESADFPFFSTESSDYLTGALELCLDKLRCAGAISEPETKDSQGRPEILKAHLRIPSEQVFVENPKSALRVLSLRLADRFGTRRVV